MRVGRLGLMILAALQLAGCGALLVGAGTETAVVVAQERSVGSAVDDAGIMISIKHLYAKTDYKDLFANVEIKSVEGRVLLTGNVDKPESQIEAVRLAWKVANVREVINEIQVNDQSGLWNYTRDVWISTQVRARLIATKGIRSINFSVITVNQVVYVMGIAQDRDELDKVHYVASTTRYVDRVVSYATIKNSPGRS